MRTLRKFGEFLKSGVVSKRSPDIIRARALLKEAEKRKKFLDSIEKNPGIIDDNANYFIENSYDTIIEMVRAKLLSKGFYASGESAHEAEVAFMAELGYAETDVRFMNELRYFRNGILYYGKDFDAQYAKRVIEFLKRMYPKLK